jgi:hypothetical protein
MYLQGTANQAGPHFRYRADGTIASATLPQLILPQSRTRTTFLFLNNSTVAMWIEIGPARAHAVMTGGSVTSVVFNTQGLDNAGFNYTKPPIVRALGGDGKLVTPTSWPGNKGQVTTDVPSGPVSRPAIISATISGGHITGFTITDPGAGYVNAPELYLENDPYDPFGCADPSVGGGSGFLIQPGGSIGSDSTACDTSAIAVFCGTAGSPFACAYMI